MRLLFTDIELKAKLRLRRRLTQAKTDRVSGVHINGNSFTYADFRRNYRAVERVECEEERRNAVEDAIAAICVSDTKLFFSLQPRTSLHGKT